MRVLLAEDDRRQRGMLADALKKHGYEVVVARDGQETLCLLRDRLPDVLVLDMVMPLLDGLAVLERIPALNLERKPCVIAAMPFASEYLAARAKSRGASKFMRKPLKPECLADSIKTLPHPKPDAKHIKKTEALLRRIGIPLYTKGGAYLCEAVAMTVADFSRISRMRGGVYEPIAQKRGTRSENVERLIRHAIETAWVRGQLKLLHELFGYTLKSDTGKPTNAEFIALIAENIRRSS